jgi:Terpene synthase family 2, C-terminal metal binding
MTSKQESAARRQSIAAGADGVARAAQAAPHVDMPPLWCPIPAAAHAAWQEVEQRSMRWMNQYGFCDDPARRSRVLATRAAEWSAQVAPNASPEGLQVLSDSVYRDLMFDDEILDHDNPSDADPTRVLSYVQNLTHVMNHPEAGPGPDPYLQTLHDVARRWRSFAYPTALRRWIEGHTTWLYAAAAVIGHRARGTLPDLDEYMIIGPPDRGNTMSIAGIEMAEGTALGTAEMENPKVRAVTAAAGVVVTFDNDLFSYSREVVRGTPESNIVGVLRHSRRLTVQAAVADAVQLRDRIMCLYLTLRDQIRPRASSDLGAYLDQLDHYIRGNVDWSLTAPRYQTKSGRSQLRAPAQPPYADGPSDGSLAAPPIPAIAWWWENLDRAKA